MTRSSNPGSAKAGPAIQAATLSLAAKAFIAGAIVLSVLILWLTDALLTERYTETTRNRAELRLALYSGNISGEVQRNAVVPLLLSRDTVLIEALATGDFSTTSQRLISYENEMAVNSMLLLDLEGRAVAATDRNLIGSVHRNNPYFVDALRAPRTIFSVVRTEAGGFDFSYARRIERDRRTLGVIVVRVDLARLEAAWRATGEKVLVTDSEGTVILATDPRWRGRTLKQLTTPPSGGWLARNFSASAAQGASGGDPQLTSPGTLLIEGRIPFQGWQLAYFTSNAPVRDRVNGVLALQVMTLALLLALGFYILSRRARSESLSFQRESIELRRLNARLEREIAEREKVERNLQVAEQSLAQSSKLAALGEMATAISHELNQPLAAMKTYLAGASLLLHRHRPEEALSSFQRIDDLIERMGAITRQLKSYARKGTQELRPVDMRDAVASALAMMAPQLNRMQIHLTQTMPRDPVPVLGDAVRLEQVIVNLLRNALDATRGKENRSLDILLTGGDTVTLAIRDNGPGIEDLDKVFEPFYTTKQPGDGIGLGLAISSGIVKDLGGRLTGRNAEGGGAVFEVQLPRFQREIEAAE